MILADSSVWINHFRRSILQLQDLVIRQRILIHPLVIGEVVMGSLRERTATIAFLDDLPLSEIAGDDEVRGLVERERLYSLGLGYVDAHLLSATLITPDCKLWTADAALHKTAVRMGCDARILN